MSEQHPSLSEHSHAEVETYYLDQLCLLAVSGAFAGICLTLYFWRPAMLALMLAPVFHKFILASGLTLLLLVICRAIHLWWMAAPSHEAASPGPQENLGCCAASAATAPAGAACSAHAEPTAAMPADCGCGHEHHWAPWRYVVLLLPISLYLLGLPNKPPPVSGSGPVVVDLTEDLHLCCMLVGTARWPLACLPPAWAATAEHVSGPVRQVGLKELEAFAFDPVLRQTWQGQYVKVVGQFSPAPRSDRFFEVVRFRMSCCAADAIRVGIPAVCRESLSGLAPGTWVEVTGRILFHETRPNIYVSVLQVPRRQNILETAPDPNPYLQ
jgi:hypothetical protein